MDIKKIIRFCEEFNIDLDSLGFYPGYKREILMTIPDEDFVRIYPQEQDDMSSEELEKLEEAREKFHDEWWYMTMQYDYPAFNVYY